MNKFFTCFPRHIFDICVLSGWDCTLCRGGTTYDRGSWSLAFCNAERCIRRSRCHRSWPLLPGGKPGMLGGPYGVGGRPFWLPLLATSEKSASRRTCQGWVPVIQERILGIHPTFVSHRIPCDFLPIGSATWKASVSSDFPERRTADPDRIMCFLFWTSENSMSTFVPFQTPFEV